ncbi:MAG: hypothetical protein OHK0046_26010 [Anaerolineae bacterium]
MNNYYGTCPMSQQDLVDEFFMEYRAKLVAVAAFLDRMERSVDRNAEDDFRVIAFREALHVLASDEPGKVEKMQMILSDRDTTLMDERDRQSAYGAFNPASRDAVPSGD